MGKLKIVMHSGAMLGAAVGISLAVPSVASANPPAVLGGLNLDGYCVSLGYAGVTLVQGGPVGPNFAYNNWRCVTSGGATHPFSMEQACKAQYGVNAVVAKASDPNNAYTWNCYAPGNAGS